MELLDLVNLSVQKQVKFTVDMGAIYRQLEKELSETHGGKWVIKEAYYEEGMEDVYGDQVDLEFTTSKEGV